MPKSAKFPARCSAKSVSISAGYYLYDTVKSDADTSLSEKLAKRFERYVESCLEYMGKDFFTESQLRERLGRGKVTDFLVPDEDRSILVEVKAVELAPLVQVLPFSHFMIQRLKGNVVKAAVQGYTMVERLRDAGERVGFNVGREFFLLVVTYRDLNLGTGREAWEEFLGVAMAAEFSNPDTRKLPPENIFVLSITELEQIIATCASAGLALVDYFARAASRNAQIGKGRYYTVMHFDEEEREKAEPIPFLWKRFEEWADRIIAKVGCGSEGELSDGEGRQHK